MTSKATRSNEPVGRLLGWLGLRDTRDSPPAGFAFPDGGGSRDLTRLARHQLIGTIMAFLVDNDLDVSPANLLLAHAAFSGTNPHLARQISTRSQSPGGINQQWLDELADQDSGQPDRADLDRLIARLETNLDSFHANTKEARSVTSDYGSELEQHVVDLEQLQKTGRIVSSLADLARVMLDRTRKAEDDMRKSEDEAKALRRSLARAKRDAEVDFLTGLPNRRAFDEALARDFARSQRSGHPLSLLVLDIDHFKTVNDSWSHSVGDQVLCEVARLLAASCRDSDLPARLGGEEFALLLNDTPLEEAQAVCTRLQGLFHAQRNWAGIEGLRVTFSAGLVQLAAGDRTPLLLFQRADKALYQAKSDGRDRICLG